MDFTKTIIPLALMDSWAIDSEPTGARGIIVKYSPPSEWIMCELGVFPIFLKNDLLKVDKILGLTFFKARKDLEGFNTAFFNLL